MSTYIDIHIIQNLPPSCVNRDDSGSPKSAVYGGVRRLRVSSQSWKRATRLYFNDLLDADDVGVRTKRVVEVLAAQLRRVHLSSRRTPPRSPRECSRRPRSSSHLRAQERRDSGVRLPSVPVHQPDRAPG